MLILPPIILTAASQVLSKGHHVLHNVELTVRKPASKDRCRLLLQGLNPNTNIDMIELYVENMMGVRDFTLYPSQGGDFILIHLSQPFSKGILLNLHIFFFLKTYRFKNIFILLLWCSVYSSCFVDFQNLSAKISKKMLNGSTVTLEQIEQTDSILVENLHPGTTPDLLTLYFESNGGGNQKVKSVTLLSESTAKVSFVNYECKFCIIQPFKTLFVFHPFSNKQNVCIYCNSCEPCPGAPTQTGRC